MKWRADPKRHEAMTAEGYRITWHEHQVRGPYFNAFAPNGKHIQGSHDREKCKTTCEEHLAASTPQLFPTTAAPAAGV